MAGPWEQYQAPEAKTDTAPADTGPWTAYAPKKAEEGPAVAVTPGEKDFEEDKRLVAQAAGILPGELKAATYSGLNAFLLGAPSHVVAAYTAMKDGKSYEDAFKEQQRYETALERQYPVSSGAGTAAGIGAGLFVGTGEVGLAANALKAATAAKLANTAAPQLVKTALPEAARLLPGAGVAGTMTGISSALENPVTQIDTGKALKDAALGAGIGATAELALPALTKYFSKFPDAVDPVTKELTPEAKKAVDQAFGGRMDADAIETFKDQLAQTFKSKGISPEAAKEALLVKEGVTPTRTMVTGEKPKEAAADIAQKAAVLGEENLGQKVSKLAGEGPESPTGAAGAIHGAERNLKEQYDAVREAVSAAPGAFKAEAFDEFLPSIEKRMMAQGIPTSFESAGNLYPEAAKAKKFIEEGIAAGNLVNPNAPFNMDNVELSRRALVQFQKDARSLTDRRAVGVMLNGFDDALNKALVPELFSGNGSKIIDDLKQSREIWQNLRQNFYDNKGTAGSDFKRMMGELADRQTGAIKNNLPQGSSDAANFVINTSLLNPKVGEAMYSRLETALGKDSAGIQTVKDQIRNRVLSSEGGIEKLPASIDKFLSQSPAVARKVFKDNEISDMRRLSESIKAISNSRLPNEQKEGEIVKAIKKLGSIVGAVAMWNFHSPVAGAITFAAGQTGQHALGAYQRLSQRAAEKGAAATAETRAPEALRFLEGPVTSAAPVRNIEPFLEPDQTPPGYQAPTPLGGSRMGRKSGGRVSDRLVAAVDSAKKNINNDTKVLLNADDSHVAKALEVANQHIEG